MIGNSNKKGFTLIELMIVITVIAILAAIALFAFNRVQRQARDSRRKGDMKALQTAIVAYYAERGVYPGTLGALCGTGTGCTGGAAAVNYIGSIPTNPLGATTLPGSETPGQGYYYQSPAPNSTYSLCAGLEVSGANPPAATPVWGVKGTSSTAQEYTSAALCQAPN